MPDKRQPLSPDKKYSVRLGELARPLQEWLDEYETNLSQAVREALSNMLGVDEPDMKSGNPNFGKEKNDE